MTGVSQSQRQLRILPVDGKAGESSAGSFAPDIPLSGPGKATWRRP